MSHSTGLAAEMADNGGVQLRTANVTPEEGAAVVAVVTATLDELREQNKELPASGPSAWERSRRGLRSPLVRGTWRPFNG